MSFKLASKSHHWVITVTQRASMSLKWASKSLHWVITSPQRASMTLKWASKIPVSRYIFPMSYHITLMSHTKVSLWSTTSYHIRVPMSHSLHSHNPAAHLLIELTNEPSSTKEKLCHHNPWLENISKIHVAFWGKFVQLFNSVQHLVMMIET